MVGWAADRRRHGEAGGEEDRSGRTGDMALPGPKTLIVPAVRAFGFILAAIALLAAAVPAAAADATDWITGLPREPVHVAAWPGGKKVAVCFVLYVEVWGYGHGPNFRSDMVDRDPDVVDEAFREYAIEWGIPRVGRLFKEQGAALEHRIECAFPGQQPDVWKAFHALVPNAPIIAHGLNNSTALLPLGRGLAAQEPICAVHWT